MATKDELHAQAVGIVESLRRRLEPTVGENQLATVDGAIDAIDCLDWREAE